MGGSPVTNNKITSCINSLYQYVRGMSGLRITTLLKAATILSLMGVAGQYIYSGEQSDREGKYNIIFNNINHFIGGR